MDLAFFDSYAIIEIIKSNEKYKPFYNTIVITTKLNLFEIYYSLLKNVGREEADYFLDTQNYTLVDFDEETIRKAADLKLKYSKQNLSMVDCIGYTLAKRHGIKFLTGDKEFKYLENVEFVQ